MMETCMQHLNIQQEDWVQAGSIGFVSGRYAHGKRRFGLNVLSQTQCLPALVFTHPRHQEDILPDHTKNG